MYFFETYRTAITAIFSNKVRSFLTMLGVIIGVMAVVLLISIGKGVQNYITDQFEALGSNLIFVSPGSEAFGQDPAAAFSRNKLQDKHVELIQRYAGDVVDNVTPYVVTSVSFIYKTKSFSGTINAGNELSLKVYNFEVAEGRFYTRSEVRSKSKVIVLGPDVVKELFSTEPAIGKKVKIDNDSYEVVGILKPKGQNYDNGAIAPHTSIMETFNIRNFSNIVVKSKSGVEMSDSIRLIERALRRDLDEDEFNILSQQDILSSIQNILQMLTIGLGAIAAISLVVE